MLDSPRGITPCAGIMGLEASLVITPFVKTIVLGKVPTILFTEWMR